MRTKGLASACLMVGLLLALSTPAYAAVPQTIGTYDCIYGTTGQVADDCYHACHEAAFPHHQAGGTLLCEDCHDLHGTPGGMLIKSCLDAGCHNTLATHAAASTPSGPACAGDGCHGAIVASQQDGHRIPVSPATTRTPSPIACGDTCHAGDAAATPHPIETLATTHHRFDLSITGICAWCHPSRGGYEMRTCEACHSMDSLHAIPAHTSDQAACEGCHGAGPLAPVEPPAAPPAIASVSAAEGPEPGLAIEGSFFGDVQWTATDFVSLNGAPAEVVSWTDTRIVVRAPRASYVVQVTTRSGVSDPVEFDYTMPSHIAPTSACTYVGCHGADLKPIHSFYGCDGCHASSVPTVQQAIAAGSTDCLACHSVPHGGAGLQTLTPAAGLAGATIAGAGRGFLTAVSLTFTGPGGMVDVPFAVLSDTALTFVVPDVQAGSYTVALRTGGGLSSLPFEVEVPPPPSHLAPPSACDPCHGEPDLVQRHSGCYPGGCAVCHESTFPVVMSAIADGRKECAACHAAHGLGLERLTPTTAVAGAMVSATGAPLSLAVSLDFISEGGVRTAVPFTIVSDAEVTFAVPDLPAGQYTVELTTAYYGPRSQSFTIKEMPPHVAPPNDCSRCHMGDLLLQHSYYGSGCAVCHESPSTRVQNAITSGTTECLACHTPNPPAVTALEPAVGLPATSVSVAGLWYGPAEFAVFQSVTTGARSLVLVDPALYPPVLYVPKVPPGRYLVEIGGAHGTSVPLPFTVTCAVSGIEPVRGPGGTTVVLSGQNFGDSAEAARGQVSMGGVTAEIVSWSDTSITLVTPAGLAAGDVPVVLTTDAGIVSAGTFTFVPAPVISSVAPASSMPGTVVRLTGSGFSWNARSVSLVRAGDPASSASFTVLSDTQMDVVVPKVGPGVWQVSLATEGGAASTTVVVPCVISKLSAVTVRSGDLLRIDGTNFGSVRGPASVYFGGIPAVTYTVWGDSQIRLRVPAGLPKGACLLTVRSGTYTSAPAVLKVR